MPSSRLVKAILVAAFALSGANAGPCKPSSSITTTTAGITSDTTSETTASETTTSVASTTTTETSVSTTETSLSSTESSESTSETTSGTTTIETTTTTSTTASESATTTAASCTLSSDLYVLDEVCGRHGSLGTLPEDSHVETGLTLEECATKANAYSGFPGQTGGMSFIFNTDGICNIFAGRADNPDYDASVFAVSDSGTDLQYNINCFDCPDNNPIRDFPRCVVQDQQQAPDRRRVEQLICGVAGSISGSAEPYQVYDNLDRNAIAEQCAEKCYDDSANCETFVVVDGSSCKLYHQATSVLNFVSSEESTLDVYDRSLSFIDVRRTIFLNVYLENLDRIEEISVCFDPFDCPQELFTWTEQHSQRDAARLKVLSDGAIRGLVVMERILNHVHLQALSRPPPRTWVPKVIWTAACFFSAVTIPVKLTASIAAAGAIAGVIGLVLPPIWNFIHRGKLEKAQKKVQNLKRAFEERTIEERNRHDLEPSQFSFLRWDAPSSQERDRAPGKGKARRHNGHDSILRHLLAPTIMASKRMDSFAGPGAGNAEAGTENHKKELLDTLESIKGSGSFASFAGISNTIGAGLFVHGIGEISMPLSEFQACQLIEKARQAPYGKGSETLVDTAVRNTWELDAEQFEFRAPTWSTFIRNLCGHVGRGLGINTPITPHIYKMLVTEKVPGMFGTLVVSLPSTHQGGTLVLKHCGETKVFDTSKHAQSFACWYSDVSHEVLPVTSGYRWVITYNLALDPAQPRPSAGLQQQAETQPLREILTRWLAKDPESRENPWFYHVLDHDYTEANSSLRALKAQDLLRVQALKMACRDLPLDIFLGLLEKKEMGCVEADYDPCERRGRSGYYDRYGDWNGDEDDEDEEDEAGFHFIDEVLESSYKVKTLLDLDGHKLAEDLHFEEEDILLEDCFEGLDAEEDYEGYMGNSGPLATHWYRVTAVAIVPRDSAASFFGCEEKYCGLGHILHDHIGYFARACLQPEAHGSATTALFKLWEHLWSGEYGTRIVNYTDGNAVRDVLKVALLQERFDLFEDAATRHSGLLPLDFFTWVRKWLSDGDTSKRFQAVQKGLKLTIASYPHFADQLKAISSLAPLSNEARTPETAATPDDILEWARDLIGPCVDACENKVLGAADGQAMVDVALRFDDRSSFLLQTVVPLVSKKHNAVAFLLGFLTRLHERSTEGIFPLEQSRSVFLTLAGSTIVQADFTQLCSELSAQLDTKRVRQGYQTQRTINIRTAVSGQNLAKFWPTMIAMDTESHNLTTSLVLKLVGDAPRFKGDATESLWLPFLHSLIPVLTSNSIPLDTPCYQQLFSAIIKSYLDNVIGKEPRDISLSRSGVNCTCVDCEGLNENGVSTCIGSLTVRVLTAPTRRTERTTKTPWW
ncbi:hypothetical protein NM208_g9334 [Fusarium decemcellulare]|uniref:Uncharacterized protein n=1 Tax=Fusarium decemcellulare TaxID=57161 RepID=A0ACC1S272_9HYPO|nr:hypothetical protein NM208_g9334 [Fusarium decemcellulare]